MARRASALPFYLVFVVYLSARPSTSNSLPSGFRQEETGFSGEACSPSARKCQPGRQCASTFDTNFEKEFVRCTQFSQSCLCIPLLLLTPCSRSEQCESQAERCYETTFITSGSFCMSCDTDQATLKGFRFKPVDAAAADCLPQKSPKPTPDASPTAEASIAAFTNEPEPDADATAEEGETVAPTTGGADPGVNPAPETDAPAASSPSAAPTGDGDDEEDAAPTEEPICIAANALEHLPKHELVFARDRRAAVLCDVAGSCATAGHMVVFEGRALSMRSFCDMPASGGCVRRVMSVNSPRLRRGLRVPSRTNGLHFTAMAAAFETRVEEKALAFVIHMGW